jgi:hypothetical protein
LTFKGRTEASEVIDFHLLQVAVDGAAETLVEERDRVDLHSTHVATGLLDLFLLLFIALRLES